MRQPWDSADLIFPQSILLELRKAFTLRGLDFFQFYQEMRRYELGKPVESDVSQDFIRALNALLRVVSPVDNRPLSPSIVGMLSDAKMGILQILNRIEQDIANATPYLWHRLNLLFVPVMIEVAKDKGVYIKVTQAGTERWGIFRKMTESQIKVEKLKVEDPESYALIMQKRMTLEEIDANIKATVEKAGFVPEKRFLMGRPVTFAKDPLTGDELVYARDGAILTPEEYIQREKTKQDAVKILSKEPRKIDSPAEDLRSLSDAEIDKLEGPLEWDAWTDDKAKIGGLTKIFATKRVAVPIEGTDRTEAVKVIVSGRYKGIFLDDMINANGRLVEGTAFGFDPKDASPYRIPKKLDPGNREPYVSVADVIVKQEFDGEVYEEKTQKLFLKIPGNGNYTELRKVVKALACNAGGKKGCIDTISYHPIEGSHAAGFYFEPKDFAVIRDALKGMALSEGALLFVKDYYKELALAEEATAEKNLQMYTPEALGNFKPGMRLLTKQRQALAWMDANGNKGTCALDVGIGKTSYAIANMMKLVRDGYTDSGSTYTKPNGTEITTNGRFLFVCPDTLKGNLPNEARKFLTDPMVVLSKLDTLSYKEFTNASFSRKVPGALKKVPFWKQKGTWDPELYVAIFFDEGHELVKVPGSKKFRAANELYHPHKIVLTASPMESEPVDAYLLASITENKPLSGASPEVRKNRLDMRRFMDRFTDRVDGRVINVKEDPSLKRDLDTWVKRKIYYAEKTDVEEFRLPKLTSQTVALEMDPELEAVYRAVTSGFSDIMKGMVLKFRDQKLTGLARNPELEKAFSVATAPLLRLLSQLSNSPSDALRTIASIKGRGVMPNGKPVPKVLARLAEKKFKFSPEALEDLASRVGEPKLEQTLRIVDQIPSGSRALVFSDDKALCLKTGAYLSTALPGIHVVAIDKSIHFFRGGKELPTYVMDMDQDALERAFGVSEASRLLTMTGGKAVHNLPVHSGAHKRYPDAPADPTYNVEYQPDNWQQFTLKELVCPDPNIRTCTLLGSSYQTGHNLQPFNTVIHLDRNSWSNENMKQRTGRSWRQGQQNPVKEFILDSIYGATDGGIPVDGDTDKTLDEIRGYFQQMEAGLFQKIIKDAQSMALGKDWNDIKLRDASNARLSKQVLELMMSPYAGKSRV